MNSARNIFMMLKRSIDPQTARRRRPVAYQLTNGDCLERRAMMSGAAAIAPLTAPTGAAVVSGQQASALQVSYQNCDGYTDGDHGGDEGEDMPAQILQMSQ